MQPQLVYTPCPTHSLPTHALQKYHHFVLNSTEAFPLASFRALPRILHGSAASHLQLTRQIQIQHSWQASQISPSSVANQILPPVIHQIRICEVLQHPKLYWVYLYFYSYSYLVRKNFMFFTPVQIFLCPVCYALCAEVSFCRSREIVAYFSAAGALWSAQAEVVAVRKEGGTWQAAGNGT